MPNPNDPTQPNSKKPGDENQPEAENTPQRSSFDFELPPEVKSHSELPPVPAPGSVDSDADIPTLPPQPNAAKYSSGSFDFIDLPPLDPASTSGMHSGTALPKVPTAPAEFESDVFGETPTVPKSDSSMGFDLPAVPNPDGSSLALGAGLPTAPNAGGSGSSLGLGDAIPTGPGSTGSTSSLNLGEMPSSSGEGPATSMSSKAIPDISSLYQSNQPASSTSFVSRNQPQSAAPDMEIPNVEPPSSVMGGPDSDLPVAESVSDYLDGDDDLPVAEPLSDPKIAPVASGWTTTPTPDIDEVYAELAEEEPVQPVAPASGWLDPSKSDPTIAQQKTGEPPVAEAADQPGSRSSFDFKLSQPDIAPIKVPGLDETGDFNTALPPRPVATERPSGTSFDFIDLPPDSGTGSGSGLQNIPATPTAIDTPEQPLLTPTSDAIVLPPVNIPADPEAAIGGMDAASVKPASDWLDSGVLTNAADADLPETFDTALEKGIESSDIFTGSRKINEKNVEQSDIIAAAFDPKDEVKDEGQPPEALWSSDIALNFNLPPGGSTEIHNSDVPVAEAASNPELLKSVDTESIHDMPGMPADPLFDSSQLARTPDLPSSAPNYGRPGQASSDASSILDEFSDFRKGGLPGEDSSSVRVESPGVDRTLTPEPVEGGFDLTVPDGPAPVSMFDEPSDVTLSEAANEWKQGGSDLFAESRRSSSSSDSVTDPDLELPEAELPDAEEADYSSDPDLMEPSPSSIFSSGSKPHKYDDSGADLGAISANLSGASSDMGSASSANVRIGEGAPPSDSEVEAEFAEFSDYPELNETSERPQVGSKNLPPPRKPKGLSSADFALPDAPIEAQGGAIDWDEAALAAGSKNSPIVPEDASISSILRGGLDDETESPTREKALPPGLDDDSGQSVSVDWMSNSSEASALKPSLADRTKDRGKKPAKAKPKDFDSDVGSAETKVKPASGPSTPVTDSRVSAKEKSRAKERPPEKPAKKGGGMLVGLLIGALVAGGASAGVYFSGLIPNSEKSTVQVPPNNGNKPGNNPPQVTPQPASDVQTTFASGNSKQALEMLKAKPPETVEEKAAAGNVRVYAAINGAGTPEDLKQAQTDLRAVVDDPDATKPENVKRAVKAAVDLGISFEAAGDTDGAKKVFTEAKTKFGEEYAPIFDALLEPLINAKGAGTSFRFTPAELEKVMLSVGILLQDDTPKAGSKDDPEPGVYYWKAVKLARGEMYTEAIEQIKLAKAAHEKRAKSLAGRGLNPLTDPLEKMFPRSCDELAAYWKLKGEDYRKAVDDRTAAVKDANTAKANLKVATDKVTKLEKDAEKFDADLKAVKKDLDTAKTDLVTAKNDLKAANDNLTKAADDLKAKDKVIGDVAAELKSVKILPEKWEPSDLVASVKTAASFATGVDAKRIAKAEAEAKEAKDKLATETKRITDKYETDIKKLKDDQSVDVKKLTDKYEGDIKRLTDDQTAGVKKLKDDFNTALEAEKKKTNEEMNKAKLAELNFQKQLANAISPSQALDLWLPRLTDLRRESDADPAIQFGKRALASSVPGTDDEAKAHTTIGMGLLLKGKYPEAKHEFDQARLSAAYKADKDWAKIADAGLDAVADPLSPYRAPVVLPAIDAKTAARALDFGITAYRAGKYEAAMSALADAAKNDPTDPVAWYYLGATRWAMDDRKQALKDIAQGGEREKYSPLSSRIISTALTPLQGEIRDAIDKARP